MLIILTDLLVKKWVVGTGNSTVHVFRTFRPRFSLPNQMIGESFSFTDNDDREVDHLEIQF